MISEVLIPIFCGFGVIFTVFIIIAIVIEIAENKNNKDKEKERYEIDIYGAKDFYDFEEQKKFEKIEKALGFKLYRWQKTYIVSGSFRCYGKTTAECLRELLKIDASPLDYSKPMVSPKEYVYRDMMSKIQEKLIMEGIQTRTIFWNMKDKYEYEKNYGSSIRH